MTTSFSQFGLHPSINSALAAAGIAEPTPVQQQAIPAALKGQDVMASAQTGTGKTAAFVLPALHRILSNPSTRQSHGPRMVVLTPTRELAQQVLANVKTFSSGSPVKTGVVVGGVTYGPQYALLKNNLDVLVATPGRLIDHLQEKRVDFSRVEMVVLDEADRMLDMGFLKPVMQILAGIQAVAPRPQILLFSATFNGSVDKFAKGVLQSPVRVELAHTNADHSQIEQKAYRSDGGQHKQDLLQAVLAGIGGGQAIIFSATKHGSEKLAKTLGVWGYEAAALHGGMRQNVRTRTLQLMHKNKIQLLVATDVAARGIDVKLLSHVINYDLPQVAEDYVHRIGRTGRAGDTGIAISLVAPTDYPMLKEIEKLLGKRIPLEIKEGNAPALNDGEFERQGKAAPKKRGGGGRSGGSSFGGGDRGPRSSNGPRKSFGDRAERAPYAERGERSERPAFSGERKSWGAKPTGERSSYAGKPSTGGYKGQGDKSGSNSYSKPKQGGYKSEGAREGGRTEGRSERPASGAAARPTRTGAGGGFKGKASGIRGGFAGRS